MCLKFGVPVRLLSYRPEFKDWVKEHPQAMSHVVELIEKMISNIQRGDLKDELIDGDTKVIYINKPAYSDVFKVIIGEDKFFVKRDKARIRSVSSVGGQDEYYASLVAKRDFKNDPDIEVIDFQLGYTNKDSKNPVGYFVSKWEELETVAEYLNRSDLISEERQEIENKIEKAKILFGAYHDISIDNMFYDPKTRKIKMFDLNDLYPEL